MCFSINCQTVKKRNYLASVFIIFINHDYLFCNHISSLSYRVITHRKEPTFKKIKIFCKRYVINALIKGTYCFE